MRTYCVIPSPSTNHKFDLDMVDDITKLVRLSQLKNKKEAEKVVKVTSISADGVNFN